MKKKIICVLVVVMLVLSVIGLTACGLFGGSDTSTDQEPNNVNKFDGDTSQEEQAAPELAFAYDFDISALQFSEMLYPNPNIDETATDEELATAYEEYLLALQQYQIYVNEINAVYEGSTFAFYDDDSAILTFADGSSQSYSYTLYREWDYINRVYIYYIRIGYYENNRFVIEMTALLEEDILLFSMQIDDAGYNIMYLQFVVSEQ